MNDLVRRFLAWLLRPFLGPSPAEIQRKMVEDAGVSFFKGFDEGVARSQRGEPFEGFSPETLAAMHRSAMLFRIGEDKVK